MLANSTADFYSTTGVGRPHFQHLQLNERPEILRRFYTRTAADLGDRDGACLVVDL